MKRRNLHFVRFLERDLILTRTSRGRRKEERDSGAPRVRFGGLQDETSFATGNVVSNR